VVSHIQIDFIPNRRFIILFNIDVPLIYLYPHASGVGIDEIEVADYNHYGFDKYYYHKHKKEIPWTT